MTEQERIAKDIFEKALVEAWATYNEYERIGMLARQEAIHRAHEEFVKTTGKQAVFVR